MEEDVPSLPADLEHVPLVFEKIPTTETCSRAEDFYNFMNMRRTVRHFSKEDVPIEVMYNIIKTAGMLFYDQNDSLNIRYFKNNLVYSIFNQYLRLYINPMLANNTKIKMYKIANCASQNLPILLDYMNTF